MHLGLIKTKFESTTQNYTHEGWHTAQLFFKQKKASGKKGPSQKEGPRKVDSQEGECREWKCQQKTVKWKE